MNCVQRVVAVNLGLARAEQVEIGAGEDKDGRKFSQGTAFRLRRCGLPLYGLLDKRQSEADFRCSRSSSTAKPGRFAKEASPTSPPPSASPSRQHRLQPTKPTE